MSGLRIHPRTQVVTDADIELSQFMADLEKRYDLTLVETAQILQRQLATPLKYLLRYERHGNYEKKADEA